MGMSVGQRVSITCNAEFLVCPVCSSEYLHHDAVAIFNREGEDATDGLHVEVWGQALAADRNADEGNPSGRRDGVTITFWCEGCEATLQLEVVQIKGRTALSWVRLANEVEDARPASLPDA